MTNCLEQVRASALRKWGKSRDHPFQLIHWLIFEIQLSPVDPAHLRWASLVTGFVESPVEDKLVLSMLDIHGDEIKR